MTPRALALLHHQSFAGDASHGRPYTEADMAALLASPHSILCPAPDGASGFCIGRVIADEAEVLTLAVAPVARRRGLGGNLLAAFETAAKARSAERAFLEVGAGNVPALTLYAGAGYREVGRRAGYYAGDDGRRADALILSKPLAFRAVPAGWTAKTG